ncbi:styrene monooxygenase/indole monooxygenase family protein [Paenibacillus beijingensis]|uniref:styrene monooxygenase/indole monooxygenase family protein n=1 Tax=Paenibacillus beijingensis TaxID=1126833 RepID=UPI00237821CB|nr:styrene monooxygenase/indole monooxygenase family protein [Paenibacillus beijingensis]
MDATGKAGPLAPFPIDKELSPLQTPQRKCIVGYFNGVAPVSPEGVSITVLPGIGEMFEIPALTERGPVTILFIEAVPGGELDAFKGVKTESDFQERMLGLIRRYFPDIESRIDQDRFGPADERAILQTAITPVIYRPYTSVNGTLIVGCGDSVFLNDPITGQGCNTASYCAERLAQTLKDYRDLEWDQRIGEEYWSRTRPYVKAVTAWTNAMMGPLPVHIGERLMQAAADQTSADEVARWFEDPLQAYEAFFHHER